MNASESRRLRLGQWLLAAAPLALLSPVARAEVARDCPAPLSAQQRINFPVGKAFYLPLAVADAKLGCKPTAWKLYKAPQGNQSLIQSRGSDSYARFIPELPGRYLFVNQATAEEMPLEVVSRDAEPFINYNYYPTRAQALIGQSLWVTNVLRGEVNLLEPETLALQKTIPVGSWPVAIGWAPGMDQALVVQKGDDSIGLIDVRSQRLIDSIWVGDEPSNIIVAPALGKAFIALSTEDEVAVLDLATRRISGRIAVGSDPQAMALSPDQSRLYVASKRSGKPGREPYGFDAVEDEKDIAVIDTRGEKLLNFFYDVATTIHGLTLSPDGSKLYMSHLSNDTVVRLTDPKGRPFEHQVSVLDASSGERIATADLLRQTGSGGPATTLFAPTFDAAGRLWVLSEASDLLLQLDPQTLVELQRVPSPSRARSLLAGPKGLYVFSHQDLKIARFDASAKLQAEAQLGRDPRSPDVAAGQKTFTGAGQGYAVTWSCNSCHLDGGTDTNVWNAGPFVAMYLPRPIYWQEGTAPIGWPGYMSSVRNSGIEAHSIIAIKPTTEQGRTLGAYLRSLTVPPPANSLTERDGSLSAEALAGKALYEGDANCASCHALPLGTNNKTLPEGITPGQSSIPTLVGAYRHKAWLKHGEAATLEAAVIAASQKYSKRALTPEEFNAVTRYVKELSGRDFFVLASEPGALSQKSSVSPSLELTFSLPIMDKAENLEQIELRDASGQRIEARVVVKDERHLQLEPTQLLRYASRYEIKVPATFKAWSGQNLQAFSRSFTTVEEPELRLEGKYLLKIGVPGLDPVKKAPDLALSMDSVIPLEITRSENGDVFFKASYPGDLVIEDRGLISGSQLELPPLPVPVFMGNAVDGFSGFKGPMLDTDGDGWAESASGVALLAGPGINWPGRSWRLEKAAP